MPEVPRAGIQLRHPRDDWQADTTALNPFMLGCIAPVIGAILTLLIMSRAGAGGTDVEAVFESGLYTAGACVIGFFVLLVVFRHHAERRRALILAMVGSIVFVMALYLFVLTGGAFLGGLLF